MLCLATAVADRLFSGCHTPDRAPCTAEVQACPYISVLTPTILSMISLLHSTISISFAIWSDPGIFFSVCSLTGFVYHDEFISTSNVDVHFTRCTRCTDVRFLFSSPHERHTALHKFHPHLTLPSVNDSTGFTAGQFSASTLLKPHARHPFSATTPLAIPACHLFVVRAPRRCSTARSYRHFRPLCTSHILHRPPHICASLHFSSVKFDVGRP